MASFKKPTANPVEPNKISSVQPEPANVVKPEDRTQKQLGIFEALVWHMLQSGISPQEIVEFTDSPLDYMTRRSPLDNVIMGGIARYTTKEQRRAVLEKIENGSVPNE